MFFVPYIPPPQLPPRHVAVPSAPALAATRKPQTPVPPSRSMSGTFTVGGATGMAAAVPARQPTGRGPLFPPDVVIGFKGRDTTVSVPDIVRLSDCVEKAGKRAKFVIHANPRRIDKYRGLAVRHELLRLGTRRTQIRMRFSPRVVRGEVVVFGDS